MNDIEKALLTWYGEDDRNYKNPRPAILGLVGEAGELIDLYKSHEYKPRYSWWICKNCGELSEWDCRCADDLRYTPLALDELGDRWWYFRILSWIAGKDIEDYSLEYHAVSDIAVSLSWMNWYSVNVLNIFLGGGEIDTAYLGSAFIHFINIITHLGVCLDEITEINYHKLNDNPDNHGWRGA